MTDRTLVSVLVPAFNEEMNVEQTYKSIVNVFETLPKCGYEIIFTDNHSMDRTFEILKTIAYRDPDVKVIRFSKNVGYQKSLLVAYQTATGDCSVQIDCDLQDPPELIPQFLKKWKNGYYVVYGIRKSRQEKWIMNIIRKTFYRLIKILSEDPLHLDVGDFQLIDRKVIDVLKNSKDSNPYLRGMIAAAGFEQIGIPYDRNTRTKGKSKFSMGNMISLALDGLLNHSIIPLRVATFTGFFVSIIAVILSLIYFIGKLIYGPLWNAGFATTTILLLLSIGLNGFFLGILGEYVGRIYKQVKDSHLTIIEEKINI